MTLKKDLRGNSMGELQLVLLDEKQVYKSIDVTFALSAGCSLDAAKGVIDWRIKSKKGVSQRVFDSAVNTAVECVNSTPYDCIDDVFLRWEESGWSGIKYVLVEARKMEAQAEEEGQKRLSRPTRESSLHHDLTDRSWAK